MEEQETAKKIVLRNKDKSDVRQIYLPNKPNERSAIGIWIPPDHRNWCIMDKESCGGKFDVKNLKEGIFSVIPTHTVIVPYKGGKAVSTLVHQVDVSKLQENEKGKRNLLEGFPNMVPDSNELVASAPMNPIMLVLSSPTQVTSDDYEVEFSLLEQED